MQWREEGRSEGTKEGRKDANQTSATFGDGKRSSPTFFITFLILVVATSFD